MSEQTQLVRLPNWSSFWRRTAVILWSAFMGAILLLLALLIGWDVLVAVEQPDFGLLSVVFLVAWLISALTCIVVVTLISEPQAEIRVAPEDDL